MTIAELIGAPHAEPNYTMLPYEPDRIMARAYVASGQTLHIRRNKHGSVRVHFGGLKGGGAKSGLTVPEAMKKLEKWYATSIRTQTKGE